MIRAINILAKSGATTWLRLLVAVLIVGAHVAPVSAQPAVPEYKLKAVFLFRFTDYVMWPPKAFEQSDRPFVIGIIGTDPFGQFLDDTIRGETVKGHAVQVKRFKSLDEITSCNMLFVGTSAAGRVSEILQKVKGRPILTVSDISDFATNGGMIRFTKSGSRVGFRINVNAAKEAGLSISAKLLQMAQIVSTTK
ncbi:MAG: YfiR family protein [Verrucomicrobiales bacterium]|nr:YfiR family protein [Verrucomicrobiales bacterium]